jgi:hypothetical protein
MQRAVNPQTGEVLFLVNNQWVPPSQTARNPQTGQFAYLVNNEWQIQDQEKNEVSTFLGVSGREFAEAAVPEFDLVKRGLSSAIRGIAGAPAGIEAAVRVPVRKIMGEGLLEQSELYQLGRRLFGREPTEEELEQAKARKIEIDRAINQSLPLIPGLQELAEGGRDVSDFIRERQSQEALEAERGSQMQGNLLEAITTGDYSKLSFGENPTLYGYALQAADVLGSLLPVVIASALGPGSAAAVGGGMAAGEAAQNAKDFVKSKSDVELAAASPYYKDLIAAGVPAEEAREIISNRAAEQAAFLQGSVAAVGGAATQKLISGSADKIIGAAGRNRLMKIAVGGALVGLEEGTQEFLEGIAADLGISAEVIKESGEDSFANFVLGFIGGAPVGAVRGALPDQQQPAPVAAPPGTTPAAVTPTTPAPPGATPTTVPVQPTPSSPVAPIPPSDDVLGGYNNAPDNTQTLITRTPDNRFQVTTIDTATGQQMDSGTFDTVEEADAVAGQIVGFTPPTPPAVTPPAPPTPTAVTPPAVTPTPVTVTPPTPPSKTAKPVGRTEKDIQADINKARQELKRAETAFKKNEVGQEAIDVASARLSTFEAEKAALKAPPALPPEVTAPEVEAVPEAPAKRQPKTVFEEKMFGKAPVLTDEEIAARTDLTKREKDLQDQYKRIKAVRGYSNLADFLTGKAAQPAKIEGADRPLPDGMLIPDADFNRIDFGLGREASRKRNTFLNKTGKGRPLRGLIEDGIMNEFLPDNLKIYQQAEGVYDPSEIGRVENAIDHIVERIENNDLLSEDDKFALRLIDEKLENLSKELTLEQINARLAEIAAEERAGEVEGVAPAIPEEDLGRVETPQLREPSPEERRRAELERDFFSLTPPTPPERTTPPGAQRDLFGVEGLERATPEKVAKRKAENAQQLSLFVDSKLPANEDNQAGETARREAVSTVDDLQSTDTPLALALSTDYARRQRVSLVGQKVTGYDDLAVLSQVYRHPRFETFRLFFVNDANEVVSQLGVTSRLPAAAVAIVGDDTIQYMKKVQDAAVQAGATGVWMLHNHPSGNVEVSNADLRVTKTFTDAFKQIAYKGHIVIDTNKYSVITPEGYVQTYSKDMGQKELLQKNLLSVSEAFHPIEVAKRVDENPQSMVVIAVGNDLSVTGITTIDNDAFKDKTPEQVTRILFRLAISQSGGRLLVASRDRDALTKVAPSVEDGIWIEPSGQYKYFSQMFRRRTKFLFPDDRSGVVTPDTSKLFDFLRVPKVPRRGGYQYFSWPDMRKLMEKPTTIKVQEPQSDLFGEDAKTLKTIDEDLPKAKKKLPPGRSHELAAMAELLKEGSITKEEYDAAVNRFRPIPLYTEPLTPATDEQVVNALSSDKKPKANVSIANGTKVGLRLDIPAWNNHKTFVVSIHEGRPKITSPSPGKAIGYRSVAMAKNVTFGLGNQAKALEIATGAAKDALQTMEGEYVNVSPSAALEMAQKAINDPRYVQLGFDPTRHAYFYDRRTTLPVVKADAVLQIGNMILARGVEYGSKQNFLYNIDAAPQITPEEATVIPTLTREEKIAEYAALRARRERLVRGVIEGGATVDLQRSLTHIDEMSKALKSEIGAEYVPNMSPENFLRKALEAFDKGDLNVDVLATIQAAYNKTPWLLNGLRLSIRTPKKPGRSSGNFNPINRIVTLWNGTGGVENPSSVRHEIMHSLEQMMTDDQRNVLIESWQDALKKAVKANPDQPSQEYFSKVLAFLDTPSEASFAEAVQAMPSYDFYQYLNPSEYWAINAEKLMASKLGSSWDRFVKAVKKLFEGLKSVFGFNNNYGVHKVFDQLMRDKPTPMNRMSLTAFVVDSGARPVPLENIATNIFGQPIPKGTWGSPNDSKMDNVIYILQDKHIDTKRVVQNIKAAGKNIADRWDPYLQEELFHGRAATQTKDFLKDELEPLMVDMRNRGLTMAQVEEYLHNRHAESRNKFNAKRDPKMPDGGSGILTADAQKYLAALTPQQKADFDAIAKRIDKMVAGTQQILVDTGQETQQTVDAWNKALQNYVPLQREEVDYDVKNVGIGVGSGIAVKGPFSRAAVGSSKQVVDILANLAMQRERAIVRGEKMRVSKALYGLVASNPNPTFWLAFDPEAMKDPLKAAAELASLGLNPSDIQNIIDEPVVRKVDPVTNQVVERPNALLVNSRTSIPVRINGKEKYVIFNAKDPRAERMAEALKNLDADQLGRVMGGIQQFTQFFARINTQYNPVFGVINFLRDTQAALIQVSNTPLKGDRTKILGGVPGALRGIYAEELARRSGKPPLANTWSQLWEEFQQEGGQTGFRDQFSRQQERADALQAILDPSSWTKSPLGKVFTVGGTLKVPMEIARKTAAPLFDWLSDYNQTMENAIRLSAYKAALDKGMTKQQAASLAKNLTVNFNRKGQIGRQAGALYAFFNASVQGAARMGGTMFKYDGKGYKLSTIGRNIIGGGLVLGVAQAMTLAAMGFDEDEPPDFIKERNFIIPTGKDKYLTIPMPLGYNVIPNTSRILTEWMLSGFKNTPKRVVDLTGAFLEMFNPLGNAGWSFQTFAPTVADPIVALSENKDWTGKPIAKKDMSSLDPTPGYTRAKETASAMSKQISYYLNLASGGTDYTPGVVSPTPDQIDYLIGQLTGGVGRELLRAEQTVTSQFTGEELPIYKVPLLGRFVGETTGVAAERNRFYNNLIELNKHEREIKGRIKDKIPTKDYFLEYPEARLFNYANQVERNIRTLRQRRDMLIEKGAPKEQVKAVENQMMVQMKRFNDRIKEAQQ